MSNCCHLPPASTTNKVTVLLCDPEMAVDILKLPQIRTTRVDIIVSPVPQTSDCDHSDFPVLSTSSNFDVADFRRTLSLTDIDHCSLSQWRSACMP
jgi:hypothetical protein